MNNIFKITFVAILLVSCSSQVEQKSTTNSGTVVKSQNELVTVQAVKKPIYKEFTMSGKVVVDPDRTISYSALVNGVIVKNYFSLGDRVKKGAVMVDIRSTELSTLQSELIVAKRNLQSAEQMAQDKLISELELVEARSVYEKLKSDLSIYGESRGNGIFSITAPMDGYVISKRANAGTPVSADSEPLFSISNLSTIWIEANVFAGNIQFVHEGEDVEITSIAYPKDIFYGKIDFLSQVFDPDDKALKARIVLSNDGLKLKPEMSVVVKLTSRSTEEMVTIPSNSIIFDNNRYFVVVKSEKSEIREIVPFNLHNEITYVASGLECGEKVVIKNQLLIYNEIKGK